MRHAWLVEWSNDYNYGTGVSHDKHRRVFITEGNSLEKLQQEFSKLTGRGVICNVYLSNVSYVGMVENLL